MRLVVVLAVLLATMLPFSAQAQQSGSADVYRIGPEDMLQISVWKNCAMSKVVPVRPDGKISLPLLNDVHAAGLTVFELRDVLMQKLVEFIPSPEVWVIVLEVHSISDELKSLCDRARRPGAEMGICVARWDFMWDGLFMRS